MKPHTELRSEPSSDQASGALATARAEDAHPPQASDGCGVPLPAEFHRKVRQKVRRVVEMDVARNLYVNLHVSPVIPADWRSGADLHLPNSTGQLDLLVELVVHKDYVLKEAKGPGCTRSDLTCREMI